jgi:CheY-like chemotaxis protein
MAAHTVLIVEDDLEASGTMKDVLQDEGYSVVCAPDGRSALAMLDSIDHVCLILLDLFMPVMNGWDFLQALRARPDHGDATVVVVSSAPDSAPSGVADVLAKPLGFDDLLGAAARYCPKAAGA